MNLTPEYFKQGDLDNLDRLLGMVAIEIGTTHAVLEMPLKSSHLNILGSTHGGSVVALADTAAGYATYANLPDGAVGFTTMELKCNFVGAVGKGTLSCRAECIHRGRTTQVWDATVFEKSNAKKIAEYRCTQLIIYPKQQ